MNGTRPELAGRPGLVLLPALWELPALEHEPFLKHLEREALVSAKLEPLRAIRDCLKMLRLDAQ